ncbi:MAG TPA: hypothetical protein VMW72_11075 [Sedimentisphaerales bacterium]|nr:hypothetical protein [Sedimentisphaerales bacterium]
MAKRTKKKKTNGNGNGHTIGRPTRYRKDLDELVYKLCLLNAIDSQIADILGISEVTLNAWMKKYPTFPKSIKKGKAQADAEVAKMLFHRACGYSHKDVHISNYQGKITVTEITKHYPPDTAAACFWLKNRAGWKDAQDYSLAVKTYTPEECDSIREMLASRCVNTRQ